MKRILFLLLIYTSCNIYEHSAFKFKDEEGKFTSHPPKYVEDGISISLSSTIGGNQKYQGFDNDIFIKNESNESVSIKDIKAHYILSTNEKVPIEVNFSFGNQEKSLPLKLMKSENAMLDFIVQNQELYEFVLDDSVKLFVSIDYETSKWSRKIEIKTKKYYDREVGIVMP